MASFRSGRLRGFVGSAAVEIDDVPGTFEGVGELDAVDEDDDDEKKDEDDDVFECELVPGVSSSKSSVSPVWLAEVGVLGDLFVLELLVPEWTKWIICDLTSEFFFKKI